jgi:hypothetical protein
MGDHMAESNGQPVPTPNYPPRHWTDTGDFRVLVFTPDDLPTWKVHGENPPRWGRHQHRR